MNIVTKKFMLLLPGAILVLLVALLVRYFPASSAGVAPISSTQPSTPAHAPAATEAIGEHSQRYLLKATLTSGSKRMPFAITFNGPQAATPEDKDGLETLDLQGAIVDFVLPSAKLNQPLKRADVGGKELVNAVSISYDRAKQRTDIVFRFATAGQGEGLGNIGIALAIGASLSGDDLTPMLHADSLSGKGTLMPGSACSSAMDAAKSDLATVEVTASSYILFLDADPDCEAFYGFVLFSTGSSSRNNPYFEMYKGITDPEWAAAGGAVGVS